MTDQTIHPDVMHRWVLDLFMAAGSSAYEAKLTADHLLLANLSGHDSHGVGMIPRYVRALAAGELVLNQRVEVITDLGSMLILDAKHGIGQSVTHEAMTLAIARAKQTGVCIMGLRNSHHLGRVGHWAEQAVKQNMIAIHFTNAVSQHWVAPHGGAEARFVTNPFTVGIPRGAADGGPIILDFATSAIAQGKVRVAYNAGKQAPDGALIDHAGKPTTDPAVLFEPVDGKIGALTTMAAHKGYALAMVCELLGAALTGGSVMTPANQPKAGVWNNMFTIVFDPSHLGTWGPNGAFEVATREFVEWVKSAKLADGFDEIMMPGDPERKSRAVRMKGLPIDAGTVAEMEEAARSVDALNASRADYEALRSLSTLMR
jgi:hydroxycarboxylate dehydrogenase B